MLIRKNFGFHLLPKTTNEALWREVIKEAIIIALHGRCPQTQIVLDINEVLLEELGLLDDARDTALNIIEDLQLTLAPLVERHGVWMRYNILTVGENYYISLLGDYRILEWEKGRGKPQDENNTHDEFNKALEFAWGLNHKPAKVPNVKFKTEVGNHQPTTTRIDGKTIINGAGHTAITTPPTNGWTFVDADPGELFEVINDTLILANWKDIGICILNVEDGTLCAFEYSDATKEGHLSFY